MPDHTATCWKNGARWYLENEAHIVAVAPSYVPTPAYAPAPKVVDNLADVSAIAMAETHSCALLGDHSVRCWGENTQGELGDGTREDRLTPVRVRGLTDAVEVRVGASHSCARLADGTVRCWGGNGMGAIDQTSREHLVPSRLPGISNAVGLALGAFATCVLSTSHEVVCVGGCLPIGRCGLGYTEAMAKHDAEVVRTSCGSPVQIPWLP